MSDHATATCADTHSLKTHSEEQFQQPVQHFNLNDDLSCSRLVTESYVNSVKPVKADDPEYKLHCNDSNIVLFSPLE